MKEYLLLAASPAIVCLFLSATSQAQSVIPGPGDWGADADGFVANRSSTSGSTSPFHFGNSSGPLADLDRTSTVPEPASFGLLIGLGTVGLLVRRRGRA
ncbi:MAG: PEP-CTERM sorting domain-containing protein [Verrucomicrobia bacterium]|nr:PEP-CTERM sorting domain-containing protein [Verrucomicrobiota bacterium]